MRKFFSLFPRSPNTPPGKDAQPARRSSPIRSDGTAAPHNAAAKREPSRRALSRFASPSVPVQSFAAPCTKKETPGKKKRTHASARRRLGLQPTHAGDVAFRRHTPHTLRLRSHHDATAGNRRHRYYTLRTRTKDLKTSECVVGTARFTRVDIPAFDL